MNVNSYSVLNRMLWTMIKFYVRSMDLFVGKSICMATELVKITCIL